MIPSTPPQPPSEPNPKRHRGENGIGLFAFDPGHTTGYAIWKPSVSPKFAAISTRLEVGQIEGWHEFCAFTDRYLRSSGTMDDTWYVIGESYTITAETLRKSRQYDPLKILGVVEYIAESLSYPFETQAPSAAKSTVSDSLLKDIGLYDLTLDPAIEHGRDALRHLVLAGLKRNPNSTHPWVKEVYERVGDTL